jgi:hypothetical protein
MTCSINSSRHQLGACWRSNMLLGLLGLVVHCENKYLSKYNVFTYNPIFYIGLGGRKWVDGWQRLGSDDDFQIRQVLLVRARFCCWARWARFFMF